MNRFALILILGLSIVLTGCHSPEVRFTDMRPRPTAGVSGDKVTVQLGGDIVLEPRAVATQTLDFSSQVFSAPTNTWRVEINVAERLSRAQAFLTAFKN